MKLHAPRMAAACLALAVLLVSCPSPLGNANMGTIRLSFSGASRGVIEPRELADPSLAIRTLLVDISGPGMERLASQPVAYDTRGTALTLSVPAGPDRAVTVSARDEAGTSLYSQTQTVAIVAGTELRLSFNLDGVPFSVSFDANGGSGTMAPQSIAYGSKAALTPNAFTRAGYSFVGWAPSATSNANYADKADYTMSATNATLYAVWMANTNTVAFNANGGTGTMVNQVIAKDAAANLTANSFEKAGYTFGGWSLTAGGAVAFTNSALYTMGTTSVTLYAIWTPNINTVTFNANSGTGTMADQVIATDASANLTANSFYKVGYTFGGWSLTAGGAFAYANNASYTMGTTSVTLYAIWNIITISGQFTGSVLDSGPKNNGGMPTVNGLANSAVAFTSSSGNLTYGSYSVTTDGAWTYLLDTENATVNALAVGYSITDTFIIDASGITQTITITIWGADETSNSVGQYIQGDGSGGGGGGASGANRGGNGGAGGGGDDTITGTAGNDVIFGDGSGGGKGGRGVGMDDTTGVGAGLGGGGADSIYGGTGDDIIFGDGFNGTMDTWHSGKGGLGGGGGGGSGGNLGTYLGTIGGLGAGSGSGYAGSVAPLVAGFGVAGGSGTTPGGNSATSIASVTGLGGASYGPGNGHGGGGGFGGGSGGAGASTAGPGNPGQDGNVDEHRYDDSTGSIHAYVLGRLATVLADYPAYGAGGDTLDGGPGSDHLFGLGGADTFAFELDDAYSGNDIDTVWDFNVSGTDKLSLRIGGTPIGATLRDSLIAAQVTEGADRRLVFSNQADKQVSIVIKNLGRDIVASDFAP